MKAKEFLKQVRKLEKLLENKRAEKAQWEDIAYSTTAGGQTIRIGGVAHGVERVQSSGNQQKMSAAADCVVDIEREIDACIYRLANAKRDVNSVIEQLDVVCFDIIHKMYIGTVSPDPKERIKYYSLYDIAAIYDRSYNWAKSTHGRALKDVQRILDERK